MSCTEPLYPLADQHAAEIERLRQLMRDLEAHAQQLTTAVRQVTSQLHTLRALHRQVNDVLSNGGPAHDA